MRWRSPRAPAGRSIKWRRGSRGGSTRNPERVIPGPSEAAPNAVVLRCEPTGPARSGRPDEAPRASKDVAVAPQGPLRGHLRVTEDFLLLEPVDEPAQQSHPDFVLADRI